MRNTHILIVEDEALVSADIASRLKKRGYEIAGIATTGEDAIRKAAETQPDLVLMDIHLQGERDGVETAEKIHRQFGTPVIYLSAHDDEDTLQRVKISEPFGYLMKPFSERELHNTIEIALYKSDVERKLRESEIRFRSIVQDQTELICRYNSGGILTFVNDAYCRYFETTPDALIGQSFFTLIPSDDSPGISRAIDSLMPEHPMIEMVHRVVMSDGRVRWQQWRDRMICDERGRILEYQGTGHDITERKLAEDALQYRAKFEQLIAEISTQFINLAANDIDDEIQRTLQAIGEFVGVDHSYVLSLAEDGIHANVTHEWCAPSVASLASHFQNISIEQFAWFSDRLMIRVESVNIARLADFPPEAATEYAAFRAQQIRSLLVVPIGYGNSVHGCLGFDMVRRERVWLDEDVTLLKTVGNIFANAFKRRIAEELLRESEQRYSSIFNAVADAFLMIDPTGHIVDANPQAANMHDYPYEELIRLRLDQILQPEYYHIVRQKIDDFHPFDELDMEAMNRRKDGTLFHTEIKITPFTLKGTPHFLGVMRDITERKHAEEKLRSYHDLLEELVEERTMELTQINEQLLEDITERKRVEQELEAYRDHLEHLVEERTIELKTTNDQLMQEIAERTWAELQIQLTAQRLQTVIETVGEGITLSNDGGYFAIFNSEMEQITGYTRDEANNCGDFLSALYPDRVEHQKAVEGIYQSKRTNGCRDVETMICSKDGHQKILLVSTSIVPYHDGEYFLSAYHDITDRKQAEKELHEAKKVAEAANHAKSMFLANMSHELRTPLNAILGYTQLFKRDDSFTEKQREIIAVMHRSGEHLLTLINDVLDLSKIEAHKMELSLNDFHLPSFSKNITDIFRNRSKQQRLFFECYFDAGLPGTVRGDEKRLRQILLNLLSNAFKFTEKGGVTFRVFQCEARHNGATPAHPNARLIRFEVHDTGIGIPSESFEDIFLPFHQVNGTLTPVEGTGLGLAISDKLARMMGSQLSMHSVVGTGSTFWLDVELVEVSSIVEFPVSAALQQRRIIGMRGGAKTVLIADDKAEIREFLKAILAPLGFAIREAMDGPDVLRKTMECQPDVILLDLVMPGMNGLDVTRQIRQNPAMKQVVVIVISASAFQTIQAEAIAAGCDDFIAKPIQIDELLGKLQMHAHIEWMYGLSMRSETPENDEELVLPTAAIIGNLLDVGKRGHLRKLLTQLDELADSDARLTPFIEKVRQFAKEFQMNQLCQFLEQYAGKE